MTGTFSSPNDAILNIQIKTDKLIAAKVKSINWDGLQFNLPGEWELIVGNRAHFIIEEDLSPVFEIKWERFSKATNVPAQAKFSKKLHREFNGEYKPDKKEKWNNLEHKFNLYSFTDKSDNSTSLLCLICKTCNTLFFVKLYNQTKTTKKKIENLLSTLLCHEQEAVNLWSIQDFSFQLPNYYKLDSFSIQAGMSRICFAHDKQRLYFCRIATAARRLAENNELDILQTLLGELGGTYHNREHKGITEIMTQPSIIQQVRLRMRKIKPYVHGMIWKNVEADRIFAICCKDIQPIPESVLKTLYDSTKHTLLL